ncbi:MAG TPA: alpha/beta fold hydrolase [Phycisphaerae bacterium]
MLPPDLTASSLFWDFTARNWALVSIACTLVLLAVVPTMVLRRYIRIMTKLLDDTPPPLSVGMRRSDRIPGEPVVFRAFDGHNLWGSFLWSAAPVPRRGMIIFAHEYKSDRHSALRYCRSLLEAGYDVFTFDFRAHGDSECEAGYKPRQWATEREQADMLGAIALVEDYLQQNNRPVEVGLFGISRGACAAILASVGLPGVKAIIADGAFSSDTILEYYMKRWSTIFAKVRVVAEFHPPVFWTFLRWLLFRACSRKFGCRFPSVRKFLRRLHTPILFIHGEKDSYIPVQQSQMLYHVANKPRYLWIVEGAKHNQSALLEPELYALRIQAFFDRYLAGIAPDERALPAASLSDLAQPVAKPPRRGALLFERTRRTAARTGRAN